MNNVEAFIYMGGVLVVLGLVGYRQERRRGAARVRRFVIWYSSMWPFMATTLISFMYPMLHWFYFVGLGVVVIGYGLLHREFRRARHASPSERDAGNSTTK